MIAVYHPSVLKDPELGPVVFAQIQAGTAILSEKMLTEDDVEWVVNDLAELGVKIGDQFFFCYKGRSYRGGEKWRPVFKREFGEVVHPKDAVWDRERREYGREDWTYVGKQGESEDEWKPLP